MILDVLYTTEDIVILLLNTHEINRRHLQLEATYVSISSCHSYRFEFKQSYTCVLLSY
jgi:hypothetical protein